MSNSPSLSGMPPEIIQNIFFNLCDVQSITNLAQTSKQFRDSLNSPQYQGSRKKLEIVQAVIVRQYGPLPELFQLATLGRRYQYECPPSNPKFTLEFIKTLTYFGRVVEKWADFYPQMRWSKTSNSEYRRELHPQERERFRRAMYRWWIFNKTFLPTYHSSSYSTTPLRNDKARFMYLRQFPSDEIVEMCEVYDIVEGMLYDICPDNAQVQKWYEECFPGQEPLYFGTYDTYRRQPPLRGDKRNYRQNMVAESWGDKDERAWIIEDVMMIDLDKLFHFCYEIHGKHDKKTYLDTLEIHTFDKSVSFRYDLQFLADQENLLVDMEDRGVGGGILLASDTDSTTSDGNQAQDDMPADCSDSAPTYIKDIGEEYEYWLDPSDSELSNVLLEEGMDDLGNFSPYMWADGVLHPVKGYHML